METCPKIQIRTDIRAILGDRARSGLSSGAPKIDSKIHNGKRTAPGKDDGIVLVLRPGYFNAVFRKNTQETPGCAFQVWH